MTTALAHPCFRSISALCRPVLQMLLCSWAAPNLVPKPHLSPSLCDPQELHHPAASLPMAECTSISGKGNFKLQLNCIS